MSRPIDDVVCGRARPLSRGVSLDAGARGSGDMVERSEMGAPVVPVPAHVVVPVTAVRALPRLL